MASLFRELSCAAKKANLGKNSFKIFNTLVEQTLGYAKGIDNLSDRRLAYLSNVRIDRFRPALKVILELGLFEQIPAKRYQYHYRIGKTFLEKHGDKPFYTPAISKPAWQDLGFDTPDVPKNGTDFHKTEAISEKERHTSLDLNHSLSILLKPLQTLLNASVEMMQQQMQQQTQLLTTLLQMQINSSTTTSATATAAPPDATVIAASTSAKINLTSTTPVATVTASFAELANTEKMSSVCIDTTVNSANLAGSSVVNIPSTITLPESQLGVNITPPTNSQIQPTPAETKQKPAEIPPVKTVEQAAKNVKEYRHSNPVETAETGSGKDIEPNSQNNETYPILPLPNAITALIPKADYPECDILLASLKTQKQRDLFVVYQDMAKREVVRFPMPLFRTLVERAQNDALSVPRDTIDAANKPLHPSMVIQTPEERLAEEQLEASKEDEELRQMLRINSKLAGTSVEKLAERLLLTHLLPV